MPFPTPNNFFFLLFLKNRKFTITGTSKNAVCTKFLHAKLNIVLKNAMPPVWHNDELITKNKKA